MSRKLVLMLGFSALFLYVGTVWFFKSGTGRDPVGKEEALILSVPPGLLVTKALTRSETIQIEHSKHWNPLDPFASLNPLSPTATKLDLHVMYRHCVEFLPSARFLYEPVRGVAHVILSEIHTQNPVSFQILKDKRVVAGYDVDSKWFWTFEDMDHSRERMEVLHKLNKELVKNGSDQVMIRSRHTEIIRLVEEHIQNRLYEEGLVTASKKPLVKVYLLSDSEQFPLPNGNSIQDFTPP